MPALPISAWQEVSVDFKDLSTKRYLLVVTDDYLRYPIVDIVCSTVLIPRLDTIFAEFGIPQVAKTDNGPIGQCNRETRSVLFKVHTYDP